MKKALLPLLIILAVIGLLAGAGYLYDRRFGAEGPFPSAHSHGGAPDQAPSESSPDNNDHHHHHHHDEHDHH